MVRAMRPPQKNRNRHENQNYLPPVSCVTQSSSTVRQEIGSPSHSKIGRRSFLKGLGIAGASLAPVAALLMSEGNARAQEFRRRFGRGLTQGDVDILRFAAAAEILETDLWVQYQEIADREIQLASAGSIPFS
jgi:hypothetical protein